MDTITVVSDEVLERFKWCFKKDPQDWCSFRSALFFDMALRHMPSILNRIDQSETVNTDKITTLVETAQWARNRLEIIADESWHGDGRDLKRSISGIFADFDKALETCDRTEIK